MATATSFDQLHDDDGALDKEKAQEVITRTMGEYQTEDLDEQKEDDEEEVKEEEAQDESSEGDDNIPSEQEEGDEDWITRDEIRDLVESLGYSEEDMADFESEDEFQRHVRLMDRSFAQRGREISRPGDEADAALEAQQLAEEKQRRIDQANEQHRENGRFASEQEELPQLDPEDFDERLIEAMTARDERIARLEQMLVQRENQDLQQHFDQIVDNLGHTELFGEDADSMSQEQASKRAELWQELAVIWNGMEANGQAPGRMSRGLITRAFNSKFNSEAKKKDRRNTSSKAKRQAARKRGSGKNRATESEWTGPPEKNPKLLEAYRQMEEENG